MALPLALCLPGQHVDPQGLHPLSPPGLLNLEKLLRQFLISKDTLSVRMLDDTRDPTPLLKEIRDDKTATIIIHANASMSHTILLKVGAGLGRAWWAQSILLLLLLPPPELVGCSVLALGVAKKKGKKRVML